MASSSERSPSVRRQASAPMTAWTCSGRFAPTRVFVTPGTESVHATASCDERVAVIARPTLERVREGDVIGIHVGGVARQEVAFVLGRERPRSRQAVREQAPRERAERDEADVVRRARRG